MLRRGSGWLFIFMLLRGCDVRRIGYARLAERILSFLMGNNEMKGLAGQTDTMLSSCILLITGWDIFGMYVLMKDSDYKACIVYSFIYQA